jgi:hypothetical protein
VPISRIPEKSGVFLEKKRLLEREKRHFQVLAHLWMVESKLRNALLIEGILIQQSFIPLHRPPLTIEN